MTRRDLAVSETAVIVMTSGRDYKFANSNFWKTVERVLISRPEAVWVLCWLETNFPGEIGVSFPSEVSARVRFVPWRKDFVWNVLPLADVVIDTFPAGGAFIMFWAMRIARPCVLFRSDYLKPFHQLEWSPAFRVVAREDLALPPGDLEALVARVAHLIDDPTARHALGDACKASIATLDDHARFARDVGDALLDMVRRKQALKPKP